MEKMVNYDAHVIAYLYEQYRVAVIRMRQNALSLVFRKRCLEMK